MNPNPEPILKPLSNRQRRKQIRFDKVNGARFGVPLGLPKNLHVIYMPHPSGVAKARRAAKQRRR